MTTGVPATDPNLLSDREEVRMLDGVELDLDEQLDVMLIAAGPDDEVDEDVEAGDDDGDDDEFEDDDSESDDDVEDDDAEDDASADALPKDAHGLPALR